MRVRINVRKVGGRFHKRVVVRCDDPARARLDLVVAGERLPWVRVVPAPYVVLDGPPGVERSEARLLVPTADDSTSFAITGGECDVDDLVEWSVERAGGSAAWRLRVRRRTDAPAGLSFGTLRLRTNSHRAPTVEVPVRVVTRGGLWVRPSVVDFGAVTAGTDRPVERAVVVGGRGAPFRVLDVRCDDPAFSASVADDAAAGRVRVIVACQPAPGTPPGLRHARVVIVTDDASTPRIAVDVKARVRRGRGR